MINKSGDHNRIRSFGIFSTLFFSLVGFGVFTYVQSIGRVMYEKAFIATILYGFLYLGFVYMIYRTIKLNEYRSFNDIVTRCFGKFLGKIILFILSVFIIFIISIELRIFIDSIKLYILPNMKSELLVIVTLFISYYVVREGDRVLPGLNEIMFVFIMICSALILFIVLKKLNLINLLPITIDPIQDYFRGFLTFSSYLGGIIILYYLIPLYKTEEKKKVHISYKAVLFSSIFLSIVFLVCVSILNINQSIKSTWPIILSFTTIDVSGGFVERVEGIVIAIAIIFFIMNFVNLYFYGSYLNSKSLGMYKHKVSTLVFIPIMYLIAFFPRNINDIKFIVEKIIFPSTLVFSIVIPILLFIISYVKFNNRKNRVNKLISLIFILVICSTFKGCVATSDIDTKHFISSISVDLKNEDDFLLTLSYPDISEFSAESSKIKGHGSVSGFGTSFSNALKDILKRTNKSIELDHTKVIVISSDLARDNKNFEKVIDHLAHNPQISRRIYICIGNGEGKDYVNFKSKTGDSSDVYISNLFEYNQKENGIKVVTLNDLLDCFSQNKTILIPFVELSESKDEMKINGSFVLSDFNILKEIDLKTTKLINLLNGNMPKFVNQVKYQNDRFDFESQNINRILKIRDKNNINVELKVRLDSFIYNCSSSNHSQNSSNNLVSLEENISLQLKRECEIMLQELYESDVDILNLYDYAYRFNNSLFNSKIKDNSSWMREVFINLEIKNNVTGSGNIYYN